MQEFIRQNKDTLPKLSSRSQMLEDFRNLSESGKYVEAFDLGQEMLGYNGPTDSRGALYYRAFLEQQFGQVNVSKPQVLQAISALQTRLVVTTNYDTLLEQHAFARPERSITWRQPHDALSIIRSDSGVIHLHGRFDDPSSLVLSKRDYELLAASNTSLLEHISSALFFSGVLLFVGTSLDGLSDPHLSMILDSFGRAAEHDQISQAPHILLTKGESTAIERARLRTLGVEVLNYGNDYNDLAGFLHKIARAQQITIQVDPVRQLMARIRTSQSMQEIIFLAKEFIETYIFSGRQIRVGYVEKVVGRPPALEPRYINPPGATGNIFIYPATLAAWSLATGQIVDFPGDLSKKCDFEWLAKLGKRERITRAFLELDRENLSDAALRYLNLSRVVERVKQNTLLIGDFFQDWDRDQPKTRYRQFLCVPIPIIDRATNGVEPPEYGAFNIDTAEDAPLLNAQTEAHLELLSELLRLAHTRLAPQLDDAIINRIRKR